MTIGVTPPDGAPQLRLMGGSRANPVHAASIAGRLAAALMAGLYVLVLLPAVAVGTPADPLDGLIVREIRVIGLSDLPPAAVTRHLASKAGAPFRRANVAIDTRRLDELRLFSTVRVEPSLDGGDVVIDVKVKQTLRILPTIALRVTDANGLSAGAGMRSINLFGHGAQAGVSALFGGETAVGTAIDTTTITPGTWAVHTALNYTSRENTLFDYHERATYRRVAPVAELQPRNPRRWSGQPPDRRHRDLGRLALARRHRRDAHVRNVRHARYPRLLDQPAQRHLGQGESTTPSGTRDPGRSSPTAAGSSTCRPPRRGGVRARLVSDRRGRRDPAGYLQFALGGANTVRGWSLGSRTGRNQFIGTAEYTFVARQVAPFSIFGFNAYAGLQLVAFADTGLAWNHSADRQSAITGYGAGLRVLVPFVDLVRIDVAWGEPGQGAAVYFGIYSRPRASGSVCAEHWGGGSDDGAWRDPVGTPRRARSAGARHVGVWCRAAKRLAGTTSS